MKLSIVIFIFFSLSLAAQENSESGKKVPSSPDIIQWNRTTTLEVEPQEAHSLLYLNGERIDVTPIKIEGIKPGKYLMKIENLWTKPFEQEIEIKESTVNTYKPTLEYRPIYKEYKSSHTLYNILKIGSISSLSLSAIAFGASYYFKEKAYNDMVDSRLLLSQESIDTSLKKANEFVTYSNVSKTVSYSLLGLGSISGGLTLYEYFRVKKIKAEAKLSFFLLHKAIYLTYYNY